MPPSKELVQPLRTIDLGGGRSVAVGQHADGRIAVDLAKNIEPGTVNLDGKPIPLAITKHEGGRAVTRFFLTLDAADALRRALNSIPIPPH